MTVRFVDRVIGAMPTTPETFLGVNYSSILNFWSFFCDLNDRQRDTANERRMNSSRDRLKIYCSLSNKARAKSPQFRRFIDYYGCAPFNHGDYSCIFKGATLELFLMDELIKEGYDFFYIKLFENL